MRLQKGFVHIQKSKTWVSNLIWFGTVPLTVSQFYLTNCALNVNMHAGRQIEFGPSSTIYSWFIKLLLQSGFKLFWIFILILIFSHFYIKQLFSVDATTFKKHVFFTNENTTLKSSFEFFPLLPKWFGFCAGTKVFEEALNAVKFLGWLIKFGTAQNILWPVKGQVISKYISFHRKSDRSVVTLFDIECSSTVMSHFLPFFDTHLIKW